MELKPCPFCGGKASLHSNIARDVYIWCEECGAMVGDSFYKLNIHTNTSIKFKTKEQAVEFWNSRAE